MEKQRKPSAPDGVDHQNAPTTDASHPQAQRSEEDEDDLELDDLDDMLDEFSAIKVDEKKDAPSSSGPGRPENSKVVESTDAPDDFTRQLQEGMGELLKELEEDPELSKQMEALVKGLQESDEATASSSSQVHTNPSVGEESFQETIRKTMERMQTSGEQATAATADDGDDILAQLLKEMEAGGGGEGEEDLTKMFLNMMEQLTNKEMLYEPMKELNSKFPPWLQENRGKVPEDKMKMYEEQQQIVAEIVTKFEEPGYTDENPDHRQYVWERMQKMQAAGSPPEDLIANPLGGSGEDGIPGCATQ